MLDPRFPCISAASAEPLAIAKPHIVDELARELHRRRDYYPRRVAKGTMSSLEADHEIDAMAAIHADFECDLNRAGADPLWRQRRRKADERIAPLGWAGMIACLRREIQLRRRFYPDWIARNMVDAATAGHQLERIEAAHYHYWVMGRAFWLPALGPWQSSDWQDEPWPTDLYRRWRDALRAQRDRFQPGITNRHGLYQPDQEYQPAAAPAHPPAAEPELQLA